MACYWTSVTTVVPCEYCGRDHWCSRSANGRWAICRRVEVEGAEIREDKTGARYSLIHKDGPAGPPPESTAPEDDRVAPPEVRDQVYRALLDKLRLGDPHRGDLRTRGPSDAEIDLRAYRSMPRLAVERRVIARELIEAFGADVCRGIPGLWPGRLNSSGKIEWAVCGSPGIAIPARDAAGRVLAVKIRRNAGDGPRYVYLSSAPRGGPGPGALVHVPVFRGERGTTVRLTEGELKADVATALSGMLSVAVPGVGCWRSAVPVLRELGAATVRLAFDADAQSNPHVARALMATADALLAEGFAVEIETWPLAIAKGIDDLLATGRSPTVHAGLQAIEAVLVIGQAAGAKPPAGLLAHRAEYVVDAWLPGESQNPGDLREDLRALTGIAYDQRRAAIAKKLGVRVATLDAERGDPDDDSDSGAETRRTQAQLLIDLAGAAAVWHAPDDVAYADVQVDGHRETWRLRSTGFRRWLAREYYAAYAGAPSGEALQSALGVLEARAHYDGPERPVALRVAGLDGRIYLDRGDPEWQVIEVSPDGWRLIADPPVRFRRAAGMLPLPVPVAGGSVDDLRSYLNVRADADWTLLVAWLLAALRDRGPYPVLCLAGEQGSAKSTAARVLRDLVDPNSAPLRAAPREDHDLYIGATNGHVLALDNLSSLPPWMSDSLCRLATGGGFATRQLYTDSDEVLFSEQRPIIVTGIEHVATRGDLADRALLVTLDPIPEADRRQEAELLQDFEAARPRILGALLDAVACGLRQFPTVRLSRLPRMADFAAWVTACEGALPWPAGSFLAAYEANRDEAATSTVDSDLVGAAVMTLMAGRENWSGTARELLNVLAGRAGEKATRSKYWPESPRGLAGRMRRCALALRRVGIEVDFRRAGDQTGTRTIALTRRSERVGSRPSEPSDRQKTAPAGRSPSDGRSDGRGGCGPTVRTPSDGKRRSAAVSDGSDGSDGRIPPLMDGRPGGYLQSAPPLAPARDVGESRGAGASPPPPLAIADIGRRVSTPDGYGTLVNPLGDVAEVLLDGQRRTSRFTRGEVSVIADPPAEPQGEMFGGRAASEVRP